jgi:hypothetical protein
MMLLPARNPDEVRESDSSQSSQAGPLAPFRTAIRRIAARQAYLLDEYVRKNR